MRRVVCRVRCRSRVAAVCRAPCLVPCRAWGIDRGASLRWWDSRARCKADVPSHRPHLLDRTFYAGPVPVEPQPGPKADIDTGQLDACPL